MGKKIKQTTVTFEVRVGIPIGSNTAEVQEKIRRLISGEALMNPLELEDKPVVKLVRKETQYA